jgi:hypothetical protein
VSVDFFNYVIERQGARYAFEAAFHTATTTQIEVDITAADLGSDIDAAVSFTITSVFGGPEEGEEGEEDEDNQPTNICIYIIDRGGIT